MVKIATGRDIARVRTPWVGTLASFEGVKSAPQHAMVIDRTCQQGEPVAAVVA